MSIYPRGHIHSDTPNKPLPTPPRGPAPGAPSLLRPDPHDMHLAGCLTLDPCTCSDPIECIHEVCICDRIAAIRADERNEDVKRLIAQRPAISAALREHNFGGLDTPSDEGDCCADVVLPLAIAAVVAGGVRGDGAK